ncbi:MAG TPA: NAD(P)-dependent oxidoreductase [Thermoguttaceae bacterium]|nr:NAD(P)-dependent oxidoreductase [Thermoguttaceae bacterium]
MKVLIADKLSKNTVTALEALGLEVVVQADLTEDKLPEAIGDAGILVVRSTKVSAKTIEAGKALALIIRAGAGVNTIDLAAASAKGVYVANCPGKNTAAVAELTIGLLIAADRRIANATVGMRAGKWEKKEYGKARGLKGRTLGILGLGNIGKAVAQRAKALEMNVIAWDGWWLTPELAEKNGVGYAASPEQLAAASDAVTVHLAASPVSAHMINKSFLDAMKEGAILINASRGELVDTAALKEAIVKKNLRVGMDVYENEPSATATAFPDTELAGLVTCTPHVGASTDEASEAIAQETVRIVDVFLKTGNPPGTVNVCKQSPAVCGLVIRMLNKPGILADVLGMLRDEGVNVDEVDNTVFEGAKASSCSILLDQQPSKKLLDCLRANPSIVHVMLSKR